MVDVVLLQRQLRLM